MDLHRCPDRPLIPYPLMEMIRIAALALAVALASPPGVARADVAQAFMRIDGISGDSVEPGFKGWIELLSMGLDAPLRLGPGGGIVVAKTADSSTPQLLLRLASGEMIPEVVIISSPTAGDPVVVRMTLRDVRVAEFDIESGGPDQPPLENIRLELGGLFYEYFESGGDAHVAGLKLGQSGVDSDGDGMPDDWEVHYGLDPHVADGHLDRDGDGLTNEQEYRLGTNPASGGNRFAARIFPVEESEESVDVEWDSVPGIRYRILWSPDLVEEFTPIGGVHTADSLISRVRIRKSGDMGFFRVTPADP